jgi:hypothetical protein
VHLCLKASVLSACKCSIGVAASLPALDQYRAEDNVLVLSPPAGPTVGDLLTAKMP